MDGRIHFGKFSLSAGGVARNICEALWKLDCQPNFISAIGHDSQGDILKKFIPSLSLVETIKGSNTSQCTVVFNSSGDCIFLMGDMDIHQEITPELIKSHEAIIKNAPLIVFDGNLSTRTIQTILELAEKYNIPAFFEPTDVVISSKPFETGQWAALKFISPNINELRHIAEYLKIGRQENYASNFEEVVDLSKKIAKDYVDNVLVTLGAQGIIIARRGEASESFLSNNSKNVSVRHYPAEEVKELVNVSGAGDSLASGLIAGILEGSSEEKCVSVGFAAAKKALFVPEAVAECLFDKTHEAWRSSAKYTTIV